MTPSADRIRPSGVSLEDCLDIIRRRRAIFTQAFVVVLAVGIAVTALSKPVYLARATLLVPTSAKSVSLVDSRDPIATILAAAQPDSLATQLEVLQSGPFLRDAFAQAKVAPQRGVVPPSVRVEALADASIIQVTVEGGDAEEIARLANTIVDLHLERTDLLATTGLKESLDFVKAERGRAAAALAEAERKLLDFRRQHRVAELATEREARVREYTEIETRAHQARAGVLSARAQVTELRTRLEKEPAERVQLTTRENPRVARLEERLDTLRFQHADLSRDFQPGSRRLTELDAQIRQLEREAQAEPKELVHRSRVPNPVRDGLLARLAESEAVLKGHEEALRAARAQLAARRDVVQNLGPWEINQSRLLNDRDSAQAAYAALTERLRDLEIRAQIRVRTARPIERAAVPGYPIRPRKSANLFISVVLALCVGVGMAFIQEFLDDRVNSVDDVGRISDLPLLGHVPVIGAGQSRLVTALPAQSHVAESYRALRSSIGFAAIDAPLRRLLVTSASKGEGKTVTSVNLATAMAVDGKRVILVDADLRHPCVHSLLGLASAPGLSEVLIGARSLDEAIQETGTPNLRVLCGGSIPPNPAELLGSQAFEQLAEQLGERADVVLFDSPPCIPVTDPLIMAGRMDGVVLVLHVGRTRKAAFRHVEQMLRRARARLVGVLFNQAQPKKGGLYYHPYDYYGYYGAPHAEGGEANGRRNGKHRRAEVRAPGEAPELPVSGTAGPGRDGDA